MPLYAAFLRAVNVGGTGKLPMADLKEMCERLVLAEMGFAHFNALRTAVAENHPGIQRGAVEGIEYLIDPTRPASSYYNRAVGRSPDSLPVSLLGSLPAGLASVEVTPSQCTPELADRLRALGIKPSHQLCYLGAAGPYTCLLSMR